MKKDYVCLWLKADGTRVKVKPKGPHWTLPELQEKVGGYIEIVSLDHTGERDEVMIVNEEGIHAKLPTNDAASNVAWRPIVGDVLVVWKKSLR